jgi:serine protease AprX
MLRTALLALSLLAAGSASAGPMEHAGGVKLDVALQARAESPAGMSKVIVRTHPGRSVDQLLRALGANPGIRLPLVHAQVALVPDTALRALAASPEVLTISLDRVVHGTIERTASATGAAWARAHFDVDGSGIGIAIIDSGVTSWHDDLGTERVVHFADFVAGRATAYDDYGHGTHVAGIIAGSGYDSGGARRGMAPGASLVVLKALDGHGNGYASQVIAALDYAIEHRERFNIRVINLSVASGVYESFTTDPLTVAARRAVDAGIVVVTAAGNFGRSAGGEPMYGGITSPGNAPWVVTVGAGSHNDTTRRSDDTVAAFSSRGPTHIDRAAKPDLVAPGVGIESLAEAGSLLFETHAASRLWGTVDTATEPYLRLSGTSMAAPVVTGTIALMLQANPDLTPNLVKAILHYTAESRPHYDHFSEGAGALNARGAVQLARELRIGRVPGTPADPTRWSRQILWGNQRITGGRLRANASAWRLGVTWGDPQAAAGEPLSWRARENEFAEEVAWDTSCRAGTCDVETSATAVGEAIALACGAGNADCDDVNWRAAATVRQWRLLLALPRGVR